MLQEYVNFQISRNFLKGQGDPLLADVIFVEKHALTYAEVVQERRGSEFESQSRQYFF